MSQEERDIARRRRDVLRQNLAANHGIPLDRKPLFEQRPFSTGEKVRYEEISEDRLKQIITLTQRKSTDSGGFPIEVVTRTVVENGEVVSDDDQYPTKVYRESERAHRDLRSKQDLLGYRGVDLIIVKLREAYRRYGRGKHPVQTNLTFLADFAPFLEQQIRRDEMIQHGVRIRPLDL